MPGLATKRINDRLISDANSLYYSSCGCNDDNGIENGSILCCDNGFWSKHRDDVTRDQLEKFWSELSPQARQDLLRIDKQVFFEQARKNMHCSRCNGLLSEGFMQIVMYGKSLQLEGADGQPPSNRVGVSKGQMHGGPCAASVSICQDETQDPSVHPWGGVTTTRDGALTLLDCYLFSKSLKGLQNVFDSARARERERELLYPDACGGGGRGWISQGIASYGRGHGTRETCALHTARLSCDTLVDFWSALGEETRQSLLRMKEEDFVERLMYRFDNKRFCRDCRKNVIREFKELKELKRMRREPRCTSWFCGADTTFQYEVSNDTIRVDWHRTFVDSIGTYHHFEWAVGSGEGKCDILEFENVGMNGSVQVTGLDLSDLNACHITLRAWKLDGRCTEFSVKAHALKGKQCVHCRLVVGDGYVTITRGESIRRFFEHAEEAEEEEEDDDSMDKDGNDLDGECFRPQKHAKSPELAQEFLLDAATVIFKEQVEKAFREGTARQNAHSIFVCLALKLLEDRIHVACKEIITLEKQMKLLEEEEKEKREEEERRERKRTKEREKKLRRKERLRGKEKDKKGNGSSQTSSPHSAEDDSPCIYEEGDNSNRDSLSETGDTNISESTTHDGPDESSSNDNTASDSLYNGYDGTDDGEFADGKEGNGLFTLDSSKGSRRKLRVQRECQLESSFNRSDRRVSAENGSVAYKSESRFHDDNSENLRHSRANGARFNTRNTGPRFGHKVQCLNIRKANKNEQSCCGCNQLLDHGTKLAPQSFHQNTRSVTKLEFASEIPKPIHRIKKFNQTDYQNMRDNCEGPRSKISNYCVNAFIRDLPPTKKVWEPVEPQRRYHRSNSDPNVTSRSHSFKTEGADSDKSTGVCSSKIDEKMARDSQLDKCFSKEVDVDSISNNLNGIPDFSASTSSSSDNCSSCLSEGDSNTLPSFHHQNTESSSTSDSEDSSQQSDGREASIYAQSGLSLDYDVPAQLSSFSVGNPFPQSSTKTASQNSDYMKMSTSQPCVQQGVLQSMHNPDISFPVIQAPSTMGYYPQNPIPWLTTANGYMTYPHVSPYLMSSPFGYGYGYGHVQHLASPFISNNHFPMYQQVPKLDCLNPRGQINALKPNGVELSHSKPETVVPQPYQATEAPQTEPPEKEKSTKSTKPESVNTGFSLFQFGGPVALSTFRSSIQSSDEGKAPDLPRLNMEGDHACSKEETTIEEYNLFAARNGIQFSIY